MYFWGNSHFLKSLRIRGTFISVFFAFMFFYSPIHSLENHQLENVEWPLEFLTPITGSFTEYRNSTVHLGLDFKTYGINGFKLLAATQGYVESISYTKEGYGLSMITYSPNSKLRTRYAHLNDFKGNLKGLELLRNSLLLLAGEEGFSVKTNKEDFRFKKKDWIARTGETGSGVAHLHLELFDSNGFYNPMAFKKYSQVDSKFPVIDTVYLETDAGETYSLKAVKKSEKVFEVEKTDEQIYISGKVKAKVAAFDLISSRNRNGIFEFSLAVNEKKQYEKTLDFLPFKDLSLKHALYDINRSSLSPPKYVYNLFDGKDEKNYSFDADNFPLGKKINLSITISDSNKNRSTIHFAVISRKSAAPDFKKSKIKTFSSADSNVAIDFRKNRTFGNGEIRIQKLDSIPEESKNEDLVPTGKVYELLASDFSWLGNAYAIFKTENLPADSTLYLYDKDTKIWNLLKTKKTKDGLSFELKRTGILSVMKDVSPPKIYYPYLVNRNFNPADTIGENFIERFYSVSDKGSGIGKMKLTFDGQSYPFEFDVDRHFIKLQIPKKLAKFKSTYLVQIQITDRAGNKSEWFNDLVKISR